MENEKVSTQNQITFAAEDSSFRNRRFRVQSIWMVKLANFQPDAGQIAAKNVFSRFTKYLFHFAQCSYDDRFEILIAMTKWT